MRMSHCFTQTLRESPAEAEVASHQLLLRAGFIRQLAAGVFSYLPLGRRALDKIEGIIHEEMQRIGGQEISMPVVHPAEIWKETQRWYQIDAEMGRFKDRSGRDMVLGMTHEEVIADLVRKEVRSYRQLPQLLYQIQTKWRDDPRPRAGLIRAREFTMKDSYSLDADWGGLDRQYRAHYQAYFNIFRRCGLPVIAVKSDTGMMGGKLAHEFMYLAPIGEDTLILCAACGYSANRQIAVFQKLLADDEAPLPVDKVATPDCKSIEALAQFLEIPKSKTAKAVFLVATIPQQVDGGQAGHGSPEQNEAERFIFALVRGDMEVNETKLANALKARGLRPATEEEIRGSGTVPGYASPVGLSRNPSNAMGMPVIVVADDSLLRSPNLVSGANEAGYHLMNVNYGRDYVADLVADIAAAQPGDRCPHCGSLLKAVRGVEVGNIFKLGTRYSEALGCSFLDREGGSHPVIMGSYGIGTGRLLACVAEEHRDDQGLIWPISVAPFEVHMIMLVGTPGSKGEGERRESTTQGSSVDAESVATPMYEELQRAGVEILFDDRLESPGVKFKDADLIGLPLRLTVSERALKQGGVELKRRDRQEKEVIPLEGLVSRIRAEIDQLKAEIASRVVSEEFKE
jgi:prolyl-tRNA synthetase